MTQVRTLAGELVLGGRRCDFVGIRTYLRILFPLCEGRGSEVGLAAVQYQQVDGNPMLGAGGGGLREHLSGLKYTVTNDSKATVSVLYWYGNYPSPLGASILRLFGPWPGACAGPDFVGIPYSTYASCLGA